jgi:hypothetical protein
MLMARLPDIDEVLTAGHLEDLRNHFEDGYALGRKDERDRILTIIELDLLTKPEVKERLRVLTHGGYEHDPQR